MQESGVHISQNSEPPSPDSALVDEDDVLDGVADEDQNWIHGDLDEDDEIDDNVNDTYSVAFQRREELRNAPDPTPAEVVRSNFTVIAAVMAGVLVSCVKFLASFFTGSVAMFSEGVHSLVDASNDSLLLIGTRASKKKPDVEHPFGFGREVYFYTFVVSVVIFFFGGGFTIYRGVTALLAGGTVVENPIINYVVLLIGIVLEGFSFTVALRDVNSSRKGKGLMEYIRDSRSPTKFTVLLEDTAAELGMIIALAGIFFSLRLGIPQLDSIASIVIGLLMASIAVVLLRETRSLLIGEGLRREEIEDVVFIVEQDPAVIKCGRVLSMYMGPNDMLLTLDVTFDDELDEGDVLQAIDRLEAELVDDYPQCTSIFIEAESLNQVYRQRHDRRCAFEAEPDDEDERERERERERAKAAKKAAKKKAKKKAAKKKAKKKAAKKKAKAAAQAAAEAAEEARRPSVHLQAQKDQMAVRAAFVRAIVGGDGDAPSLLDSLAGGADGLLNAAKEQRVEHERLLRSEELDDESEESEESERPGFPASLLSVFGERKADDTPKGEEPEREEEGSELAGDDWLEENEDGSEETDLSVWMEDDVPSAGPDTTRTIEDMSPEWLSERDDDSEVEDHVPTASFVLVKQTFQQWPESDPSPAQAEQSSQRMEQ